MSDTRKYRVARGPFRIPTPSIEEGSEVELDSAIAAQFVREGTLNPVDFECGGDGMPVDSIPPADDTNPPSETASTDVPPVDQPPADVPPTDQPPVDQPPADDTNPPSSEGASGGSGE